VLPGAVVVGSLAAIYATFGHVPWIVAAFAGIKATVLVLVIEAMLRIGRRALTERRQIAVAGGAPAALGRLPPSLPPRLAGAGARRAGWGRDGLPRSGRRAPHRSPPAALDSPRPSARSRPGPPSGSFPSGCWRRASARSTSCPSSRGSSPSSRWSRSVARTP